MGLLDLSQDKAISGGLAWLATKLGMGGLPGFVMGFYEVAKGGVEDAMTFSARNQAIPENDIEKRTLDAIVRSASSFGSYYKDYSYYAADQLDGAGKDIQANKGTMTLIRITKSFHSPSSEWQLREGNLYLVVTRNMALSSAPDFEIVTSLTISGSAATEEATTEFLTKFLAAYTPFADARRARIQMMRGNSRFGPQMMAY